MGVGWEVDLSRVGGGQVNVMEIHFMKFSKINKNKNFFLFFFTNEMVESKDGKRKQNIASPGKGNSK